MLTTILMWIGAIVCIIGAAIIILTGLMVIREWVLENIYDWKLSNLKHAYNYEAEMLAVIHLKELKDKYPELEIHYKGEELQEWGD